MGIKKISEEYNRMKLSISKVENVNLEHNRFNSLSCFHLVIRSNREYIVHWLNIHSSHVTKKELIISSEYKDGCVNNPKTYNIYGNYLSIVIVVSICDTINIYGSVDSIVIITQYKDMGNIIINSTDKISSISIADSFSYMFLPMADAICLHGDKYDSIVTDTEERDIDMEYVVNKPIVKNHYIKDARSTDEYDYSNIIKYIL